MTTSAISQFIGSVLAEKAGGVKPAVDRPKVARPSAYDDTRMDISDRFRPVQNFTNPDAFYGATSTGGSSGAYSGSLGVSSLDGSVEDLFGGAPRPLSGAMSAVGLGGVMGIGAGLSKLNLTNIEKNITEGKEGYALGMVDGKIVGVSPGPFGGYVLSGVLPSNLSSEQRKQLIDNLLGLQNVTSNPAKDFAVSPKPTETPSDAELASTGSNYIVTDSAGRPVTTNGGNKSAPTTTKYVTTSEGKNLSSDAINAIGGAMDAYADAADATVDAYGDMTESDFDFGYDTPSGTSYSITKDPMYSKTAVDAQVMGDDGFVSDSSFKDALIKGMEKSPGRDPSLGTVYDPTATVSLTTTTDASPPPSPSFADMFNNPPPSDDSDDSDDDRGGGGGFTDSAGDSGISGSPEGEAGVDYDEDDFIDESGEFTEGFKEDDNDDGGGGGGGKIICTAMNQAYGFGSFRQAIWLAHSRDMAPEYQAGYHAIFQPLVTYGYGGTTKSRKFVRGILEGIARRRTADIWMQKKGKRHPVGRIERAFWEPVCYAVGRIVLCLKK
jgi:hypothetical protein